MLEQCPKASAEWRKQRGWRWNYHTMISLKLKNEIEGVGGKAPKRILWCLLFLKGRHTWEVVIYNCSSVIAKSDLRALSDPDSRLRELSWNKLLVPAQVCSNRADWLILCQRVSCQMCHQRAKRSRVLLDLAQPVWGPFRQPLVLSSHPWNLQVAASTHHHPPQR